MQGDTVTHGVAVCSVLLVLLVAGCLSGVGGSQPETATPSAEPIEAASETPCASSLAYYGDLNGTESAASPDRVRVGFALQSGAAVVLVATENGTVLGTSVSTAEHASVADGHPIVFDERLDGAHTVSVSAYEDTNRNGRYDRGTDRPCYSDGEPVRTRPRTFDFSSG